MKTKPVLLDLFCKAGGCTKGYQRAGFYVVGVDIEPQPRYCGDEFVQADALEYVAEHGHRFDAIHASPPCQGYSRMRHLPWLKGREYPMLIDPVRDLLMKTGKPWVIENVEDAPLVGIVLCGAMFDLKVYRHRLFESSEWLWQPPHKLHKDKIGGEACRRVSTAVKVASAMTGMKVFAGSPASKKGTLNHNYNSDGMMTVGGHNFKKSAASAAMDIDWMSRDELAQAIPPAYTEYIGKKLLRVMQTAEAV